jgi:hypothetical protein
LVCCFGLYFAAELRQHLAPGFSLGWEEKTRSFSRETAIVMVFFNDVSTLLSPFHGLTFILKHLPEAKALVITHDIETPARLSCR